LKWIESPNCKLHSFVNGKLKDFIFQEDWAKTIHIEGNNFFVAGGSNETNNRELPYFLRR